MCILGDQTRQCEPGEVNMQFCSIFRPTDVRSKTALFTLLLSCSIIGMYYGIHLSIHFF